MSRALADAVVAATTFALEAIVVRPVLAPSPRFRRRRRRRRKPERRGTWRPHPTLPFRRHRSADAAAVAAWCDQLARSLRRGSTLSHTLRTVEPRDAALDTEARWLRHRLERGSTVNDACDAWARELDTAYRRDDDPTFAIATLLGAASMTGGTVAAPLERMGAAMRQRTAAEAERRAHSAQAQLSARVLTALPLGMLALLWCIDADVRSVLASPSGAAVVIVGVTLNLLGAWWMHRIVGVPK